MSATPARTFAFAVAALGCGTTSPVEPSDVLALTVCPADAGFTCGEVADGVSIIPIQACVPSSVTAPLASNLTLTLTASAGTWQNPSSATTPSIYTASLSGGHCATGTLVAPNTALSVRVDATLAGYTRSVVIPLQAAPPTSVELTAAPAIVTSESTNLVALQAVVRSNGQGAVTSGTFVTFAAVPSPATAYATVEPSSVPVNSMSTATATLVLGPGVQWVSVVATASGPLGAKDAGTAASCVTVDVVPLEGGGVSGASIHGCATDGGS
jgi:hypothetical protein